MSWAREIAVDTPTPPHSRSNGNPWATSRHNLLISGLSPNTSTSDIKSVLSRYGEVISVNIGTTMKKHKERFYGYVTMNSDNDAMSCIQHLNRSQLNGRMIKVKRAKEESGSNKFHTWSSCVTNSLGRNAGEKGDDTRDVKNMKILSEDSGKYYAELFSTLLHQPETTDCSLVAENGKTYHVHLCLLRMVWPGVDKLKVKDCDCERNLIVLTGVDCKAIDMFMKLLYTGSCNVGDRAEAEKIIELSHQLGLVLCTSLFRGGDSSILDVSNKAVVGSSAGETTLNRDFTFANEDSDFISDDEDVEKKTKSEDQNDLTSSNYTLKTVYYSKCPPQSQASKPSLFVRESVTCSANCNKNCQEIMETWSQKEINEIKSDFLGLNLVQKQGKLLKQLNFQSKAGLSCQGFVVNKLLLCVNQFSEIASISTYILKKVLKNHLEGHKRFMHGNKNKIKCQAGRSNFVAWMKVFSERYGQDGPSDVVTILPSYLNGAELFKLYKQEATSPHLKKSTFYKQFKLHFGPRRPDKSLPWIRISKVSSHSKCDVCLGLDQFMRKTQNESELEYVRGLKQQHTETYSKARIAVNEYVQKSITYPSEVVSVQIDSMDNSKSMLPRLLEKSKQLSGMFRLPAKITGCLMTSSKYAEQCKVTFYINHGKCIFLLIIVYCLIY